MITRRTVILWTYLLTEILKLNSRATETYNNNSNVRVVRNNSFNFSYTL